MFATPADFQAIAAFISFFGLIGAAIGLAERFFG
jgi:hypothetical protein